MPLLVFLWWYLRLISWHSLCHTRQSSHSDLTFLCRECLFCLWPFTHARSSSWGVVPLPVYLHTSLSVKWWTQRHSFYCSFHHLSTFVGCPILFLQLWYGSHCILYVNLHGCLPLDCRYSEGKYNVFLFHHWITSILAHKRHFKLWKKNCTRWC